MRQFSTLLCFLALGLALEMGTSCTKQTLAPSNKNVTAKDYKVNQQDTTYSQPSTEHGCGNGGEHGNGYGTQY